MQEVPQKVLNWLHSVLVGVRKLCDLSIDTADHMCSLQEYTDVNRTYSDVARTLAEYNGLHPSTDVYSTFNKLSKVTMADEIQHLRMGTRASCYI